MQDTPRLNINSPCHTLRAGQPTTYVDVLMICSASRRMMALMNEIDLYEHKTPLPISPTSEGTPMTETHFRQTLYECAVKLRELAYTLPQGVGEHALLRMSEQMIVTAGQVAPRV